MASEKDFNDNGVVDVIGLMEYINAQPKPLTTCEFCGRQYHKGWQVRWYSPFCSKDCYERIRAKTEGK